MGAGLKSDREEYARALAQLRGAELVDKLAEILAQQANRIATLEATIKLLEAFEQNRDVLLQVDEPIKAQNTQYADRFELSASENLTPDDGFHALEFAASGVPFRWAGKDGKVEAACFVDRSRPCTASIELLHTVDPENFDGTQGFDGAVELEVLRAQAFDHGAILSIDLPPRPEPGPTLISFQFPKFNALSDQDERVAAVAFHRLVVATKQTEVQDA